MGRMKEVLTFILVAAFAAAVVWRLFPWLCAKFAKPLEPNPWDEDTEARLHEDEAVPLCPRCLEPDKEGVQFCRDCGFPTGPYAPWSPYLYVFVLGDLLRTGVDRPFRVRGTTVCFLLVVSFVEYAIFAPIYWFFLFRNVRRQPREPALD